MNTMTRMMPVCTVFLTLVTCLTGCENMNNTQKGVGIGATTGAITGAIIGHQVGHRDTGALIGAAVGGLGGGVVGHDMDVQEERDAALAQAQYQQQRRRADARAMTNADVIYMAQNGASESIIIGNIRHRGGRFDTSPRAIIDLQRNGVSDNVIQVIQQSTFSR